MANVATKKKPKAAPPKKPTMKLIVPGDAHFNVFGSKKSKLEQLADAADQKTVMIDLVGDLSGETLMGNRILVGIYIEPSARGSLFLSTETLKESVYQGTVGLVLKMGDVAFKDEPETKTFFHGQKVDVGDWVVIRPGDAKRVQIRGIDCRFVEDTLIDMVVKNPDIITHEKVR